MSLHAIFRNLVATAALALVIPGVSASDYPSRPVVLVAPYAAGGNADTTARALAEQLQKKLGQPVVVENRPGAGTMIAAEHVARAAPDGHTLLLTGSSVVVAPVLNKNKRYDPLRSFQPIGGVAYAPHILVVPTSLNITSVPQLIQHLKDNKGKISYASVGMGATNHLEAELFKSLSKTDMTHVPYKGSAPALVDLLAGRVQVMFDAYSSSKPFIDEGKLRVLGVSTGRRSAAMPDIPTVAEAGLPGFDATPWLGVSAPAGTPMSVVETLNKALREVLSEPAMKNRLTGYGMDVMDLDHIQFGKFVEENARIWLGVIESASISIAPH